MLSILVVEKGHILGSDLELSCGRGSCVISFTIFLQVKADTLEDGSTGFFRRDNSEVWTFTTLKKIAGKGNHTCLVLRWKFVIICVLLTSQLPWQRNDVVTFLTCLCISGYQKLHPITIFGCTIGRRGKRTRAMQDLLSPKNPTLFLSRLARLTHYFNVYQCALFPHDAHCIPFLKSEWS